MVDLQRSFDSEEDRVVSALIPQFPSEQSQTLSIEQLLLAFPRVRSWFPRLAQLIKILVGEPTNTNLPDVNQETP
ncbi:MAG: hypothetical protein N3D16_12850 [Anaerolineales bacterium]|nr:hypothetical protein [Anaerolineales bacterium]